MNGLAQSPSRSSAFTGYDGTSSDAYLDGSQYPSARPILGIGESDDRRNAFSPSTRALQAHAPGQSLPQGLAAGYSRIHALPPPPVIPSPSTSAAFSPGRSVGFATSPLKGSGNVHSPSLDWHSSSPPTGFSIDHLQGQHPSAASTTGGSLGGLDAMFSRLSYSAAASSEFYYEIDARLMAVILQKGPQTQQRVVILAIRAGVPCTMPKGHLAH